ncbi:MAG: hypothetical protein ACJA2G_002107 [Cognaticolwellia sp.]|jgi:hypothetical protein
MGARLVVKMSNLSFPLVKLFYVILALVPLNLARYCISCARIGSLYIQVDLIIFWFYSILLIQPARLIKTHYLPERSSISYTCRPERNAPPPKSDDGWRSY